MSNQSSVLISGSSRGIGQQLAIALKKSGMNVFTMGYQTQSDVDIRCDLLEFDQLNDELTKHAESYGRIDLLVCNAGTGRIPSADMTDDELARYFYEKNYQTADNLIRAAMPHFNRDGALIIGISSIAALTNIDGVHAGYREAKEQVTALFKRNAKIFGNIGLRFNIISPGNVLFENSRWSEISSSDPSFVKDMLKERVPLGSFITPFEIASAIEFLNSFAARNITGANLVIDGGQSL